MTDLLAISIPHSTCPTKLLEHQAPISQRQQATIRPNPPHYLVSVLPLYHLPILQMSRTQVYRVSATGHRLYTRSRPVNPKHRSTVGTKRTKLASNLTTKMFRQLPITNTLHGLPISPLTLGHSVLGSMTPVELVCPVSLATVAVFSAQNWSLHPGLLTLHVTITSHLLRLRSCLAYHKTVRVWIV